jgi:hypothetical protein
MPPPLSGNVWFRCLPDPAALFRATPCAKISKGACGRENTCANTDAYTHTERETERRGWREMEGGREGEMSPQLSGNVRSHCLPDPAAPFTAMPWANSQEWACERHTRPQARTDAVQARRHARTDTHSDRKRMRRREWGQVRGSGATSWMRIYIKTGQQNNKEAYIPAIDMDPVNVNRNISGSLVVMSTAFLLWSLQGILGHQ